jgi:hypothetical protein
MIKGIVIKGMVASLALTGSLAVAPAALADPVDPAGAPPGYGLQHAGHDHGDKSDKPKPKPKPKEEKKGEHGHHKDGDSAHDDDGDDSRQHPRNW